MTRTEVKTIKEPPRGPLRLWIEERRLSREETKLLLLKINEKHCRMLGIEGPRQIREGEDRTECTGMCQRQGGAGQFRFYRGHGVCVLKRIIRKDVYCAQCRSDEIVAQLNWIFRHFLKRFPEGLTAKYDECGLRRKDRGKKKRAGLLGRG